MDQSLASTLAVALFIFLARILDVSIGTMRIIFVSRGLKALSALAGFFEVLIWLFAISRVFSDLTNAANYISYAAGFATGNYVGIVIESRLAIGSILVRIITRRDAGELVSVLRDMGYGVTSVDAQGGSGPVNIVFTVVRRRNLPDVVEVIKRFNPNAFYTIEDVRFASDVFAGVPLPRRRIFSLRGIRKGK